MNTHFIILLFILLDFSTNDYISLSNEDKLYEAVSGCVLHRGLRLYDDNEKQTTGVAGRFRPIDELRSEIISCIKGDSIKKRMIIDANDKELIKVIQLIPDKINPQLTDNLRWVATSEKWSKSLYSYFQSGNFKGIRTIYAAAHGHNANSIYMIAAVSNDRIREILKKY